jgi:hypothetical protein
VNLAQDLSPGRALWLSDLVPEARLSPSLQIGLLAGHAGPHTVSGFEREELGSSL